MKRIIAGLLALPLLLTSAEASALPEQSPLFEASFLQGWYCRDWTASQWQTEFADMMAAGFRSVIIQSAVDLTYAQTDAAARKTDIGSYQLTDSAALLPTALVPGSEGQQALGSALRAAKETGLTVWIGTVSDSRWWNYGWGEPESDLTAWSEQNAAQCSTLIREIWEQFGGEFNEQIAGFYYNNEIWNFSTESDTYAAVIGQNIRKMLDAAESLCPEKPLMISPFFNRDLTDSAAYADLWRAIASYAKFRSYDVFAHQDGGGRDYDSDTIREWADALHGAVGGQMRFWINNETFGTDSGAKAPEKLRESYLATSQAEKHILFSWNHYYHGTLDAEFAKLIQSMTGDLNGDGACTVADAVTLHRWLMHDRITVANWRAGDLDGNGILNAADFTLLKRRLLS